jgi:hypothetical protein
VKDVCLHGTALGVALAGQGDLSGLLLLGPPGSGKSALAAELIAHCPWQRTGLIGDDLLVFGGGRIGRQAEEAFLHLRDLGIAKVRSAPALPLAVVLEVPGSEQQVPTEAALHLVRQSFPTAAAVRLLLSSLASGQSLWCGFEPGP